MDGRVTTKEVATRICFASISIGPLMLFGALPATAGQSISSNTSIQWAAAGDSTVDRDTSKGAGLLGRMAAKAARVSAKAKAKREEEGNREHIPRPEGGLGQNPTR